MSYLFSFKGRINRAKMWLFILVTLAFEVVIAIVAAVGLKWTQATYSREFVRGASHTMVGAVWPLPGAIETPLERVAVGVIAVLALLYAVALFAVYTKRLHDRNKSAWWLLVFLVIPFGVKLLNWTAVPALMALGNRFGPLGMGWDVVQLVGAVFGLWGFIELFFFRGTTGPNSYGPDPLAR